MARVGIAIFVLAMLLKVSFVEMALLTLTITMVWMAEFINAAVEATAASAATASFLLITM